MKVNQKIKTGSIENIPNRFDKNTYQKSIYDDEIEEESHKISMLEVFPKTIVNKVTSPDIPLAYSMNPYQGCSHGCSYCYARPTHEYWGYSAGIDFERKILIKKNAASLLEKHFQKKSYKPQSMALSGNTDCYQPIERIYGITRSLLSVFLKHRHPVQIITKNALIQRDIDILSEMASMNLVSVALSITTLDEKLRRVMEPQTATIEKRLYTLEQLTKNGIPTMVMMAPIIPFINSHEILAMAKESSIRGAFKMGYTIIRLNGAVEPVFEDWIRHTYPEKADRVLQRIRDLHGGDLSESRYGLRMSGQGEWVKSIHKMMEISHKKFFLTRTSPILDYTKFIRGGQLSLL